MPRTKKLPAVAKAAQLLKEASAELGQHESFRADALWRLAECVDDLATRSTFQLSLPRGKVTMNEADGGRHWMAQTAGMTSGFIKVEAASKQATPRELA